MIYRHIVGKVEGEIYTNMWNYQVRLDIWTQINDMGFYYRDMRTPLTVGLALQSVRSIDSIVRDIIKQGTAK